MTIALAGFSGFIGTKLRTEFNGYSFVLLERKVLYGKTELLAEKLKGVDIVINMAGYSISKRWTRKRKEKILQSRIDLTRNLVAAVNSMNTKPRVFVNSSAIGVYEAGKIHTEKEYSYGTGFLADVVKDWEQAAKELSGEVKLIIVRLGLVLGTEGGALPKLLPLFKLGLGGAIGSGKQVYSFIHSKDVVDSIRFLIENEGEGVYNLCAPAPVSNLEFTRSIARAYRMPAVFRVPSFILKIMLGKASSIVTEGQTVYPKKLLDEGYKFTFATIDEAILNLVNKQ